MLDSLRVTLMHKGSKATEMSDQPKHPLHGITSRPRVGIGKGAAFARDNKTLRTRRLATCTHRRRPLSGGCCNAAHGAIPLPHRLRSTRDTAVGPGAGDPGVLIGGPGSRRQGCHCNTSKQHELNPTNQEALIMLRETGTVNGFSGHGSEDLQ